MSKKGDDMRKILIITIVVLIAYPISASALTGLAIGAKAGLSQYSGDVLPGSGDVDGGLSWGLVLGIGTLPMLDLELRAGYFQKDFTYSYASGGLTVDIPFEFRDMSIAALLKREFAPPASPLAVYVGGGLGMHWMNTEVGTLYSVSPPDNTVDILANTGKMSGEGLAGLKLSAPGLPLVIFGEARYALIFATERITTTEFSGGLMLSF
jgi:hypothetical protein